MCGSFRSWDGLPENVCMYQSGDVFSFGFFGFWERFGVVERG